MGKLPYPSSKAWRTILELVLTKEAHEDVVISKFELPDPLKEGFVKHFGDIAGQIANYRLPLRDGREVHIKEYEQEYSLHWDNSSAIRNPLGHILRDGSMWLALIVGLIVVGAFVSGFWIAWKLKGKVASESPA